MATKKRVATALANYKTPSSFGSPALKKTPKTPAWGSAAPVSPASRAPSPAAGIGASASSDPTALPVDPIYDNQLGQYGKNRDDTLAGLEGQKSSALLGYGYTQGADGALAFDPNNPYSQAALARTVYKQSKAGTTNSLAAQGQLYSGAMVNAQNQNDTNFNVGENSRQNALTNFLNRVTQGETSARNDYSTNVIGAGGDRVARAATNPNYTNTGGAPAPAASPLPASTLALIEKWRTQGTDYSRTKKKK